MPLKMRKSVENQKKLLPYNKGQVKKKTFNNVWAGLQLHLQVIWKSRLKAKILKQGIYQ